MSEINDGGPAFPLPLGPHSRAEPSESGGMTLRDYFAAKAMAAYISSQIDMTREDTSPFAEETVAQIAYQFADAMLAARASSAQPAAKPEPEAPDDDGCIEWGAIDKMIAECTTGAKS